MFGIKFIKVQPTTYLLQYRGGKIVREGLGLSFFYYAPTTSLVAVPVASADVPFIFQETTADFQGVTIQGQVTYRVGDAKRLAALLNYTLAPNGQDYTSEDPGKLPERVIHVINVLARAELQKLPLREAIRASDELVQAVKARLVAADSQARFYVEHQGADFSDYLREDETYHRALTEAQLVLSRLGRVQAVDRGFLPNFVFGPDDTVVTLGQDGLVANTLKYLNGQPVVGVNPDPERWDGRLLPFRVSDLSKLMPEVVLRKRPTRSVTMAKAALNNGQTMYGVNDLFIGPKTHCSARYFIRSGEASETQSSSGIIVSTGMGSTGWLKSLLTGAAAITQSAGSNLARQTTEDLFGAKVLKAKSSAKVRFNVKTEFAWDANYLFYTVREPFPTKTTGASLVFGRVTVETPLILESRMAENGVIFSDGIEKDFLEFNSGTQAVIGIAERKGMLVE